MTRETILEQIQNNNDEVGAKFNSVVKETTERYEMGIIHHEEYLNNVEKALNKAKEQLILVKYESN